MIASAVSDWPVFSIPLNEQLTAFSSEKMALYMQCGVPFVAFNYPGYKRLADEDKCGVVIESSKELPKAIREILGARDEFAKNAYEAFSKYYDFSRNFTKVLQGIELSGNGLR